MKMLFQIKKKNLLKFVQFIILVCLNSSLLRGEIKPVFIKPGGIGYSITSDHFIVADLPQVRSIEGAIEIDRRGTDLYRCVVTGPQIPVSHKSGTGILIPEFTVDWFGSIDRRDESYRQSLFTIIVETEGEENRYFSFSANDLNLEWMAEHGDYQDYYFGSYSQVNLRFDSGILSNKYGGIENNYIYSFPVYKGLKFKVTYCFFMAGTRAVISRFHVLTIPFGG